MRLAYFSTDHLHRPRNEVIFQGLKQNGHEVTTFNFNVWKNVKDKAFVHSFSHMLLIALRYCLAYPYILARYVFSKRHDVVVVPYMGFIDVLILWPFAKLRGEAIVWDAFISIYNTVVEDRKMIGPRHPLSYLIHCVELLATRAADLIVLDTQAHAHYFQTRYGLDEDKVISVLIGTKARFFEGVTTPSRKPPAEPLTVLFFGTFIPLHGLETIYRAAALTPASEVRWVVIGKGQEEKRIQDLFGNQDLPQLERIEWIEHEELIEWIDSKADISLGIFGDTDKAGRVIPNKAYEIIARRRPFITRDSEAARELLSPEMDGVWLVPPADPQALKDAVYAAANELDRLKDLELFPELVEQITPHTIAAQLLELMKSRLGIVEKSASIPREETPSHRRQPALDEKEPQHPEPELSRKQAQVKESV